MKKQLFQTGFIALSSVKTSMVLSFAIMSITCLAQMDHHLAENLNRQNDIVPIEALALQNDEELDVNPISAYSNNVAMVDSLYKAFAKGDIPSALALMDAKIEWNEAESFPYADGNPYIGPQAVLEGVFARIGAEWEYWNLVDIELHEMSNNKVLATLRYQAKFKKNGAVIDAQTAHFWTLKDDKITHFQQFTDTDQVVRAVSQ